MARSQAKALEDGYDVFLSFCGGDTNYVLMDKLHRRLQRANIRVFGDKEKIKVGEDIREKIQQDIDNSRICIPIIPQTRLLDSTRTLGLVKLAHMMKIVSRSEGRKRIFPIFHKAEPRDVKDRTSHPENPFSEAELSLFKDALANVGPIKGWEVKGQSDPKILESVAQKVSVELGKEHGSNTSCPIEPDDLTESLKDLLGCATTRCTESGRSLSKSTTKIESLEKMDMDLGSIGKGEVKRIQNITGLRGLHLTCSEEGED